MYMYLTIETSNKQKIFFGILKAAEEKSRIWIRVINPVVQIHDSGSRSVSKRYISVTLVGNLEHCKNMWYTSRRMKLRTATSYVPNDHQV
jgi:hypothetical protein